MAIELVIFDMDGVLFEGHNFWLDLHRRYATEAVALELAADYLKNDYETLARITAEGLWKGKPAAPFLELVAQRVYQDGVFELFSDLRASGVKTALVSSGPKQLALRAQADLGIDDVRANELGIDDGRISGHVRLEVMDSDKGLVSLEVMESMEVNPQRTAAVGDGESDVAMAAVVGLTIAYDSVSRELDRVADVRLPKGELRRLGQIVGA